MILNTIFNKDVNRSIEGVIKADDAASLRLEIEEYVLTNEVVNRLDTFLDAYNNYTVANGVWISGFFGSGKSHLLKMLAILLENRVVDGIPAIELFLPKCEDEILRGDLKRAVSIPSKSILFNIDQKADVISKSQLDALLSVFVKVFDEMCGYYGKQGHIAQFERDLDSRGIYSKFKNEFEKIAGYTWEKGREQALLESAKIAQSYARVTGADEADSKGILDKYRSQYKVSIEDFAEQVFAYVEKQGPDFRLNFFVDEVGQYIADNVKLMTNLQTIAESLGTKCRGRAWIIVTSQNDMSTVLGEFNKQQSNDFSKIMARFGTKMLLTSTNVAEVIQERLLSKTDDGVEIVSDLYHKQVNNFGTLFNFTDGSRHYKIYKDREEFIRSYPFVPYQFELFQAAIENLSSHNAFEGKHSSVGERSMLGVFQHVAIKISNAEIGQLASFDCMFEGIQSALKSQTQKAILAAERQLNDTFAVQILKGLFLVKYVKEFKPTLRNICILMLRSFDEDLTLLRKRVEEALNLLVEETFIQRNGEFFEYLTDEEKDVEREIKSTEVESTDVASELEKILFDGIIKKNKIRYEENGQDYPYTRKLDDKLHSKEYELTIHVVSPFHDKCGDLDTLSRNSWGRDELLLVLPEDDRLVRDLLMYKRTEKYIKLEYKTTQQETIKKILDERARQNEDRLRDLRKIVSDMVGKSVLYIAGKKIEIDSEDAQTRFLKGFHELISLVYKHLRILRKPDYREEDIKNILLASQGTLDEVSMLNEAEQEVLAFIQTNNRNGVRTTLKSIVEKFEKKPYGWYYAGILCTTASLCAHGKVEVRADGNILEENELERAIRNSHNHSNVVFEPQVEFTASQIRILKDFYSDFFDKPAPPNGTDAKTLGREISLAFEEMILKLTQLESQETQFPFLKALTPILKRLKELKGKSYTWYLTDFGAERDEMVIQKEDLIHPIYEFMAGSQKDIYLAAQKLIQAQLPNRSYIEGDDFEQMELLLKSDASFKGQNIQKLKSLSENLRGKISACISEELNLAEGTVLQLQERLSGMNEFTTLSDDKKVQINQQFKNFVELISSQQIIAVIRDTLRRFEELEYPKLLQQISLWSTPANPTFTEVRETPTNSGTEQSKAKEPAVEYVPSKSVRVDFDKAWLSDAADVERYVDSMKKALLAEITKGKRIQI